MKRPSIIIAFFASLVQHYDYALFGLSAAALTRAYIPHENEAGQFLGFFGILSLAVIMRPLGSVIFGYIGDFKGRALVLKSACLVAAISTLFIGLLPSGSESYLLMIVCRMAFMMSMAGEIDGVRIYVSETIDPSREYFGNGMVTFCSQIGVLIATFAWWLASSDYMPEYWFRMNFIIGGVAGLVIFSLRSKLQETVEFVDHKRHCQEQHSKANQIEPAYPQGLLRPLAIKDMRIFLLAAIISGSIGGIYHFQIIFFGTYMSKMTGILSPELASLMNIIAVALYAFMAILSGYMADIYGAKRQIIFSLGLTMLLSIVATYATARGGFEISLFLGISALIPLYSVPLQIALKRIMPISSRLRVFSLSHSLGSIFSSSVPFICSLIWYSTGLIWVPMICMTFMACVLLLSFCFLRA
jgi:MHS family proline/betaine transporter-like MFS transporter